MFSNPKNFWLVYVHQILLSCGLDNFKGLIYQVILTLVGFYPFDGFEISIYLTIRNLSDYHLLFHLLIFVF